MCIRDRVSRLMKYINKNLTIEKVNVQKIAKKFGTPTYCYSHKQLTENIKKFKILNFIIVAIISFVAFIIIVDTFKYPIGKIVPNVEFILYNLYESIKDISLFIRDLT